MIDWTTPTDLLAEMLAIKKRLDDAPPRCSRIIASHRVPYGRVFRMWNTRGEMVAYVNRGEVADMRRAPQGHGLSGSLTFGIPVYVE